MWIGRDEFGPKHKRFVEIGSTLFVTGCVLLVLSPFIGLMLFITHPASGIVGFTGATILAWIAATMIILAYFFMLYQLENKKGKMMLYIALACITVMFAIPVILFAVLNSADLSLILSVFTIGMYVMKGASLLSGIAFFIAIVIALIRVSKGLVGKEEEERRKPLEPSYYPARKPKEVVDELLKKPKKIPTKKPRKIPIKKTGEKI
ncbi:MAG: hypothetical protein QMC80_01970 [Thermoplasmatales archaeon]|nr:hypothetical protein [Thermoplasmatales archaeon]